MCPPRQFYWVLLPVFFLSACSKQRSPEEIALAFYNTLYNDHAPEKAAELVTPDSRQTLEDDMQYLQGALDLLAAEQAESFTFKAITEKTVIQHDSAYVYVWTSLDSSTTETLLRNLDGNWLVDFNHRAGSQTKKQLTEEVLNATESSADKAQAPSVH